MSLGSKRILELSGVSFSYGSGHFIRDMNLALREAAFIGLLGANGSGKSTVLKLMGGILSPTKGQVNLWGRPIASCPHRDRAKLVCYLPQMLDMSVPFRVGELVEMGRYPYDGQNELSVDEALGMVGLTEKRDERLSRLSGGERRRAFIAMTLVQGAGILLLDEPLANLDIRFQLELIRLLRDLNERRGISIVMALHDINLAFSFDRLMLIKDGGLIGEGPPGEMIQNGPLKEAFGIDIRVKKTAEGIVIGYGE